MSKLPVLSTRLYLALVFLSGILVGGFGVRLYTLSPVSASVNPRNPEEFKRRYIDEMHARLHLSDQQVKQLGPILDETRQRYREFHERYKPELKSIQNQQVSKIRSILTESQQPEYSKMLDEREKQRQKSGH